MTAPGVEDGNVEAAIEKYLWSHDSQRSEQGGFCMQESVRRSGLHPLTKTLMPTKHGLMRRWIRGKIVKPSMRAVVITHDGADPTIMTGPRVGFGEDGREAEPECSNVGVDQSVALDQPDQPAGNQGECMAEDVCGAVTQADPIAARRLRRR